MCDERPLVTVLSSVAVQVNLEFTISAAALARVRIYDFSRRGGWYLGVAESVGHAFFATYGLSLLLLSRLTVRE